MGQVTYERPPLIEVTFGLHFAPLAGFRAAHFGAFWSKLRPAFTEVLDKAIVGNVTDQRVPEEWFPLPRVWFVHRNQEHLLQLQPNRFYFNWKRPGPDSPYPRFAALQPIFQEYVTKLGAFVTEESLGPLQIKGFELQYSNHIFQGEGWNTLADIGKVFPDLAWRSIRRPQGDAKGFAWQGTFENPFGNLVADIKHGLTKGSPPRQLLIFELRAVKTGDAMALNELDGWLHDANSLIVSAFEDLTNPKIQKEVWKRVSA